MSFAIGLDVGGTKIAGAVFGNDDQELSRVILPTPAGYSDLVTTCRTIVTQLDSACGQKATIGVGVPGSVDQKTGIIPMATNTLCLSGKPLRTDLQEIFGRPVIIANDADCNALSEATDGAGQGFNIVFGLILGTGVGGGLIANGKIVQGPNGLTGEFGHVPLPHRDAADGPFALCICGQKGCIDKTVSGPGLSRLYESMTSKKAEGDVIAHLYKNGDAEAMKVLDQFYTTLAKAMSAIIHIYDPDIIVTSGGLSTLHDIFNEVPKRWERYTISKNLKTKFVAAKHGPMSGMRGAAWVGRQTI